MSVRHSIPYYDGVFFITFTCHDWINYFQIANAYYTVYKWFDYLKMNGHYVVGYVIMPNHIHSLLAFRNTNGESINKIIGNGKRFMAYEIVSALEKLNRNDILQEMVLNVTVRERIRNKQHQVFKPSFDWKECRTERFIKQKLDYIHINPCKGKWNLAELYWEYQHSSARYYVTSKQGFYPVLNYSELRNIDLTVPFDSESSPGNSF